MVVNGDWAQLDQYLAVILQSSAVSRVLQMPGKRKSRHVVGYVPSMLRTTTCLGVPVGFLVADRSAS